MYQHPAVAAAMAREQIDQQPNDDCTACGEPMYGFDSCSNRACEDNPDVVLEDGLDFGEGSDIYAEEERQS